MFIPTDCIAFHIDWLSCGNDDEKLDDLDTTEIAKAIISIHYEYYVKTGADVDGLQVLDNILNKISNYLDETGWHTMKPTMRQQREFQVGLAKDLIRKNVLTLLDAICLLYTKDELGIFGL